MKKFLLFSIVSSAYLANSQTTPSFTITNNSGSNSITCSHPNLNYVANPSILNYVWVSSSTTLSGSNVTITLPGTYTITATDTTSNSTSQILVVGVNTLIPVTILSPTFANVSCSFSSAVTFTGATTLTNVTQYFISPFNGSITALTSTTMYTPLALGIFTHVVVNNINGCSISKTFTVSSNQGFPGAEIVCPQNFTLGCTSESVAIIQLNNAQTQPPGGAISFTLLPPNYTSPYSTGSSFNYSITTPGTWTVIIKDNFSSCESHIPISIISNTSLPNLNVNIPSQILTCDSSQVMVIASSSDTNVSYDWSFNGSPNLVNDTITIHSNNIAPTSTLVNTYSLTITGNNGCMSYTVFPIYQNLFPPNANISSGGVTTITCQTPTIMLTNISSTGIPPSTGFSAIAIVSGYLWEGPNPLLPTSFSSTYIASVAGVYTLTAKDLNNGCTAKKTYQIFGDCNLVGILKNSELQSNISFFPNPTNGKFTLITNSTSSRKLEIYDALGILINSECITSEKTEVDLQNASNGLYFLQITENNNPIYTSKIIKH